MKHNFCLLMATAIILTACTGMPAPAHTPAPTNTPTPTHTPTPTPEGAAPPCPTSWTVWKIKNPLTGHETYDAPPEVKACVKACYLEQFRAVAPKNIEEFDPVLYNRLLGNPPHSPPPEVVTTVQYERRVVAVLGFAPDGLSCRVADYTEGGIVKTYTWPQRELVKEEELPDAVVVYAMRYDQAMGRWRIHHPEGQKYTALAEHELPNGIPEFVVKLYGLVEE